MGHVFKRVNFHWFTVLYIVSIVAVIGGGVILTINPDGGSSPVCSHIVKKEVLC